MNNVENPFSTGATCTHCGITVLDKLFGFDLKHNGLPFCCLECVDDYEAGRTFDSEEK